MVGNAVGSIEGETLSIKVGVADNWSGEVVGNSVVEMAVGDEDGVGDGLFVSKNMGNKVASDGIEVGS